MADDPREEVLAKRLAADENDDAHWTGYLREAGLHIAALNVVDPLRALLADERQALETLTRAWWDGEFGTGSWDRDVAKATQARQIKAMRPVLAALREVAGL